MKTKQPILLVDDDAVDVMTAKRAFKEVGVDNRIDVVSNGEEAIEYLRNSANQVPCLILLDINMPRMNGIEFLAAAKCDRDMQRIPIVMLTTSKGDREKSECFRLGAAGYMIKCVQFDEFKELVRIIDRYWSASELAK